MSPERGLLGDIPVTLWRLRLACIPGSETRQRAGTNKYIAFKYKAQLGAVWRRPGESHFTG